MPLKEVKHIWKIVISNSHFLIGGLLDSLKELIKNIYCELSDKIMCIRGGDNVILCSFILFIYKIKEGMGYIYQGEKQPKTLNLGI